MIMKMIKEVCEPCSKSINIGQPILECEVCHKAIHTKWYKSSGFSPVNNLWQWRNEAPGAPATPGGAVIGGRQIVMKMWDNFARLTALLAKVRVWFNNSTIYLDFSAIFSEIAPSKLITKGRH